MTLYEAIYLKKPVKKFMMEPLAEGLLDQILNYAGHLAMLTRNQRVKYKIVESLSKQRPVLGSAGMKAPYYFLIYAGRSEEGLLNGGCLMGQIGLYLLTKSIGCCYAYCPGEGEKSGIFILPFGKTGQDLYRDAKSGRQPGLEGVCVMKEKPGAELVNVLQAAIMAPAYLNQKPWRFVAYADRIHIFMKRDFLLPAKHRKIRLVDAGLMLANLFISAEEMWLLADYEKKESVAQKEYKRYEYIGTVTLR